VHAVRASPIIAGQRGQQLKRGNRDFWDESRWAWPTKNAFRAAAEFPQWMRVARKSCWGSWTTGGA